MPYDAVRLRPGPPAGVRMAGPVALPPADQRESAARRSLDAEDRGGAGAAEAAMTSPRLAQPVTKVAATSRINDM